MNRRQVVLASGMALIGGAALAQSDKPLKAKNLQWEKVGEIVVIPVADAPEGIKVGDKFMLVDASNHKIAGTGTIANTARKGSNSGPITAWNIKVDSIKK
ncbi:MAG: hypothetical protein AB7O88_05700 [Reyranellaceae bacterium]